MLGAEITADITVYRYSPLKVQNYLQMKVARLAMPGVFETSLTLTRNLAKVGLMEDEKEALLQCQYRSWSDKAHIHLTRSFSSCAYSGSL